MSDDLRPDERAAVRLSRHPKTLRNRAARAEAKRPYVARWLTFGELANEITRVLATARGRGWSIRPALKRAAARIPRAAFRQRAGRWEVFEESGFVRARSHRRRSALRAAIRGAR